MKKNQTFSNIQIELITNVRWKSRLGPFECLNPTERKIGTHLLNKRSLSNLEQLLTTTLYHTSSKNTNNKQHNNTWFCCHFNIALICTVYVYIMLSVEYPNRVDRVRQRKKHVVAYKISSIPRIRHHINQKYECYTLYLSMYENIHIHNTLY